MSLIIGNSSDVYYINHEIHFFEEIWSPSEKARQIDKEQAISLTTRLLTTFHEGYFVNKTLDKYHKEAASMVEHINDTNLTAIKTYESFLYYVTAINHKKMPCEHTPRNLFYASEIIELLPNAKIINMIRDPRDVVLSQKYKWKIRFLGAKNIPLREALRAYINYHPITISKLWNSSIKAAMRLEDHPNFLSIRFEDVIESPEKTVSDVCDFLNIPFSRQLLEVPLAAPSREPSAHDKKGIRKKSNSWRSGEISDTEVFICQKITSAYMDRYGYTFAPIKPNIFSLVIFAFTFPVKLFISLMANLGRTKNLALTIKRRLF